MNIYNLNEDYQPKSVLPEWHFAPATTRQLKVLRFFGVEQNQPPSKGICSGIIGRLFSSPENKHLWAAYVFTTGDEDDTTTELKDYDRGSLAKVIIPSDWHPKRSPGKASPSRKLHDEIVAEILKEGSPFDDPLPEIVIKNTIFCFSGEFEYGTRKECQKAVTDRGGMVTDGITGKTQVLVIGNDPNPNWSHGSYGNKIANAMILRLKTKQPNIIPELMWQKLVSMTPESI